MFSGLQTYVIVQLPIAGACPGIRKRGDPKSENLFFFAFQFFRGGGQLKK